MFIENTGWVHDIMFITDTMEKAILYLIVSIVADRIVLFSVQGYTALQEK